MIYRVLLLCCFLLLVCCDNSKEKLFEEAENLERKGDYKEAILILNELIEIHPNYLGAYINRGADKSALKDFKGSISDYLKVLELDSINPLAAFNIGNSYKRLEDYKNSLKYYDLAASYNNELFTKNRIKQLALGRKFSYQKSPFEIENTWLFYERGYTLYFLGDFQSALIDFTNIPFEEREGDTHYMIGACLLKMNRNTEACIELNTAKIKGSELAKSLLKKYCK